MKPLVSIIIPTYAPQNYLWECLNSICHQTLSVDRFEVLIILNGEKEPYFEDIKRHISNYSFPVYVLYSTAKGVSAARNLGLDKAQGKYVCFIDDDDWVSSNYLEYLLTNAVDDGITVANVITVDDKTKVESSNHFLSHAYLNYISKNETNLFKNRSFFSSACCKIIPLNCIGKNRFETKIKRGEDSVFMFSIAWKIKVVKLAAPTCIYYIRKRENSAGRTKKNFPINTYEFMSQTYKYTYLYIKHILNNNFLFYISRIVGTFKNKIIQKT